MSMTRLHFQALAAAISTITGITEKQRLAVAQQIATAVRPFNGQFDREKFVRVATDAPAWARLPKRVRKTHATTAQINAALATGEAAAPMFEAVGSMSYDPSDDTLHDATGATTRALPSVPRTDATVASFGRTRETGPSRDTYRAFLTHPESMTVTVPESRVTPEPDWSSTPSGRLGGSTLIGPRVPRT